MESRDPADADPSSLPTRLLGACPEILNARSLCVAFSGGLDSTVLLHLLKELRDSGRLLPSLRAVHVNHGLQEAAFAWEQHCQALCENWQVSLETRQVDATPHAGESSEAAARRARYHAFLETLCPDEVLLQAHHADDQAETLLLHLLRGSGVFGLAGIPRTRPLGKGSLLRPLLGVSRALLNAYARQHQLRWVEDPSNADSRFDRNFLRVKLIPGLEQRWPRAAFSLARSAGLLRESASLLDALAAGDLQQASAGQANRLQRDRLSQWSPERQRNLLRYWLQNQVAELRVEHPSYDLLGRIQQELIHPDSDGYVHLAWGKGGEQRELHRYRGELLLLRPLPVEMQDHLWELNQPLGLPAPLGSLEWLGNAPRDNLLVRFRSGGERIPKPDGHHQTLKEYCQEQGIPPWLRHALPLLYDGEELVAIGDRLLSGNSFASQTENHGFLRWTRSQLLCGW